MKPPYNDCWVVKLEDPGNHKIRRSLLQWDTPRNQPIPWSSPKKPPEGPPYSVIRAYETRAAGNNTSILTVVNLQVVNLQPTVRLLMSNFPQSGFLTGGF